jgi:hypothetical protein
MFPVKSALWVMAILIFFPVYNHAGLEKFQTDLSKKIIDLSELNPGGPGIERQLYKAMNQLERLQRMRSGESVPAPVEVDVDLNTGQSS